MPSVVLKYRPIQYVEDPFCGESRNIGVFAYGAGQRYFRCIGDGAKESVDLNAFARLSKTARESSWVFGEWVEWFKALSVEDFGGEERVVNLLDCLEIGGSPFVAGKEAVVEIEEGGTPAGAADWLYTRLVREPHPRKPDFQDAIENLLTGSGLIDRDGFERAIEIEFTPAEGGSVRITANFALTGSRKAIFKVIRFKGAREHLTKRVNDVIYTFQQAVAHGFTSKEFCFVLSDEATSYNNDLRSLLGGHGVVINIMESTAAKQIVQILNGTAS